MKAELGAETGLLGEMVNWSSSGVGRKGRGVEARACCRVVVGILKRIQYEEPQAKGRILQRIRSKRISHVIIVIYPGVAPFPPLRNERFTSQGCPCDW